MPSGEGSGRPEERQLPTSGPWASGRDCHFEEGGGGGGLGGGPGARSSPPPPPPARSLQRPVHHVVPPSTVTEDYLRSFRPYHTAEDLRVSSLPPLGLDPATAAAYYHPSYLAPHPFPHPAFR